MPRLPRLTAAEAERLLLQAGFVWTRSKGSHRIDERQSERMVVPFHTGKVLHPKVVKEIMQAVGG